MIIWRGKVRKQSKILKFSGIICAAALAAGMLAGCGNSSGSGPSNSSASNDSSSTKEVAEVSNKDFGDYSKDNPLEIKLSHFAGSDDNQLAKLAIEFKNNVENDSGGAVKVTIYGGGTLGNDQESMDSVIAGTLDMAVNNTPIMSGYDKRFQVLDLPYLFSDYDQVYKFLDSDVAKELEDGYSSTGARLLCMQAVGFRNLETVDKFVNKPSDLKGKKIRVTGSDVYINTWKAWGANAMNMAGSEVLTALQQGTIDGCDNVDNVAYSDGLYEYAKYISVMKYAVHFNGLTINEKLYSGLTPDLQKVISKAAQDAALTRTKALEKENEEQLKEMQNKGAKVSDDVDTDAFKKASESVYMNFEKNNKDGAGLLTKIQEIIK
jgi:tripartite ATP-independent transporter DctP family solute receptor